MAACSQEIAVEPHSAAATIVIRRFQSGDEASFLRLNEEWIVRHFVLEEKDRAVLNDPVKYILNPGGQILFAIVDGETVGCCALAPEGNGVYEVAKMAVTDAYQGRGIGRMVLESVIAEGKRLGASRLYLETNSKLPTAIYLYESVGFRHIPVERRKPSLYSRADVFMEMVLD